jgi:DHA2 family multidrug resistance protein
VNPWIVAIAVMFATFMEVLDTTVVNVSLPHIAGSLSATIDESTWALTSYLVANAIVLPMTGWLASFIGRKRLLMFSVVGFTVSSFLCGLAPTLSTLILFRILQGATGGAMQPLSQAVLLEAFPPHERGKAMGFWGLGIVVAPILGPVLGGWLTDSYSWRWVFYINIPVGIASIIMTKLYIFDPPYIRQAERRVDYWGIGMLAVGIGALQDRPGQGSAGRLVFVLVHYHAGDRQRRDAGGARHSRTDHRRSNHRPPRLQGAQLCGRRLSDDGRRVRALRQHGAPADHAADAARLSAAAGGIAMAPRGLGSFFMMPLTGLMIGWFDPRKLLTIGLITGGSTLLWLSRLNLQAGYWDIFWPQLIQGVGMALLFVPLTTVAMDPIPRERMGNATSLFNLMRNIGGQHRHRRHRHVALASPAGDDDHARRARDTLRRQLSDDVHAAASGIHGGGRRRRHRDGSRVCRA